MEKRSRKGERRRVCVRGGRRDEQRGGRKEQKRGEKKRAAQEGRREE